jgi:hypothetical protein
MKESFSGRKKKAAIITAIVFVLLLGLPIAFMGVYQGVADTFTNQIFAQQQTLSDIAALAIGVKLDKLVSIATSLASSSQLSADAAAGEWAPAAGVARDLENNVNYYDPFIDRLIVYDPSGVQRAAYPELTGGLNTKASPTGWYGVLASGTKQSYVSGVTKRISSPQIQVVNVAATILSNKKIVGFLVLQIPTENFLDFGGSLSLGTYGFAYVVDSAGNLVAHPKFLSDSTGVTNYSFVPQVQKALAGKSGTDIVSDRITGEKGIVTYESVPGYGWGIITQELYSEAFSTESAILFDTLLSIIAFFVLDILICYILYYYIVHHTHEK